MDDSVMYRGLGVAGTISITSVFAIIITGLTAPQSGLSSLLVTASLTGLVVGILLVPLSVPQPRRVIDLIRETITRVAVAALVLATIGYGAVSVVDESPLLLTPGRIAGFFVTLSVVLPVWFWLLDRHDSGEGPLIVGDDPRTITAVARESSSRPVGLLSPPLLMNETAPPSGDVGSNPTDPGTDHHPVVSDGGISIAPSSSDAAIIPRLAGLSRLETLLRKRDIDHVVLAFRHADREECFGVLETCHDLGIDVYAHESLQDRLLLDGNRDGNLVRVDIEPWPWYRRVVKRAFDVTFASVGLFVAIPVIALIALCIKVDSAGPVLYKQRRTSEFGGTFPIYKFRTMYPDSETATPEHDDHNDKITRIGRFLRKTHLDELPQLQSILVGDMSVVGPRAAWVEEEDAMLQREVPEWSKRWHVKPGLTGLAQIQDATSVESERKLELDLQYVRQQSFWFDLRIVFSQIEIVLVEVLRTIRP